MLRSCLVAASWVLLATAGSAQPRELFVTDPSASQLAVGSVRFRIEVHPREEVDEVVFLVDGIETGRLRQPPWEVLRDVGQKNLEHLFEARVRWLDGSEQEVSRRTPRIRVDEVMDLGLQQLYVTVGHGDSRVLGLQAEDFVVLDDRREQTLVTFEGGDVPLTAAILVDASSSMRGERLRGAVQGARAFVEAIEDLDEAMLVLFSDHLLQTTPFTNRPEALIGELGRAASQGGTAVNDTLYFAVKTLEQRQGRRVVILLSDGVDVESVLEMKSVLWTIKRSRSIIYWIRLMSRAQSEVLRYSAWRHPDEHAAELSLLEAAVDESGGRIVPIASVEQAGQAFGHILSELREQYVLGFYPTRDAGDGSWHHVDVQVRGSDQKVRTRDGYFDQ